MRILVAGDSWSQGEWGFSSGQYAVDHGGLAQYLTEAGHTVDNVGQGGSTNELQVEAIERAVHEQIYDQIFWFHSTFERQLISEFHQDQLTTEWSFIEQWHQDNIDIWSNINTLEDFLSLERSMLDGVYSRLNKVDQPIHVIGGSSRTVPSISNYANLNTVIDRVMEWLLPDYQFPRWLNSQLDYTEFKSRDPSLMDFLLEDKNRLINMLSNIPFNGNANQAVIGEPNPELMAWIWPDGEHMNRHAHLELYKYIKEKIL